VSYYSDLSAEQIAEIKSARMEARLALRELKAAKQRRVSALDDLNTVCAKHRISARKASRVGRGIAGIRPRP
jgi:hypothetical protein